MADSDHRDQPKTTTEILDEVDARGAAKILGVALGTLYYWRCKGKHTSEIGPYQFGKNGRYRYKRTELIAFKNQKLEKR